RIGLAGAGRIGAFHAKTFGDLDAVDSVVVYDLLPEAAAAAAAAAGGTVAPSIQALLASDIDGFVITTGTHMHSELIKAGIAAGIPTFCEKPIAGDIIASVELARVAADTDVPVHVGFQRRFDVGYRRLRDAVQGGELGWIHSVRAATHDQSPPPAAYLPTSGGLFRDCSVHDFDILRFVTGREVVSAYGVGANRCEKFFTEGGDVDTAAAVLTLDDGTLAIVSATRYNGGGHDVRMEVHGSMGTLSAGLDSSYAMTSAEQGVLFPPGPRHWSFMGRFRPAYQAELAAFVDVAAGRAPSPCTVADGLQAARIAEACTISKEKGQPVELADIPGLG
ncbi:MAG: Gfo/Idh/MocA family oxidoreductase, partial [Nostocoides sp.]